MVAMYSEADRELAEYFMSSLGLQAQRYEPSYGCNSDDGSNGVYEEALRRRAIQRWNAATWTLGRLTAHTRGILRMIYEPHGWPDLLASALRPRQGHGNLVGVALTAEPALTAFANRYPNRQATPSSVLEFLRDEAGRGGGARGLFVGLLKECERQRDDALRAYSEIRSERLVREKAERLMREKERTAKLNEELGRYALRDMRRFERRLGAAR